MRTKKCGRGDRAQNHVVLRNVGGGNRGAEACSNYRDFFLFFFNLTYL